MNKPTLGRFVHYRGKYGLQVMRPALVVCTQKDLDPRGVESGEIQDLDSDLHVHLIVFTPSTQLGFFEQNIPHGVPGDDGMIPPGTWCWPVIK